MRTGLLAICLEKNHDRSACLFSVHPATVIIDPTFSRTRRLLRSRVKGAKLFFELTVQDACAIQKHI